MRWSRWQIINNLTSGPTWVLSSALTSHTHTLSSFLYITTVFHLASLSDSLSVSVSFLLFSCGSNIDESNFSTRKIRQIIIIIIKYDIIKMVQICDWHIAMYVCATAVAPIWTVEDSICLPHEASVRVKYFQLWDLLCSETEWKFINLQFCYNLFFFFWNVVSKKSEILGEIKTQVKYRYLNSDLSTVRK